MNEATFPLLGATFIVLIVLPVFALLAKLGLMLLERDEAGGPLHGLNLRYLLLTGSSALPVAWLLSAGLHQAESGSSVMACLLDHETAELCFEAAFFVLVLAAAVLASSYGAMRQHRSARPSSSEAANATLARVSGVVASDPALACLRGRIEVTEDRDFALGVQGLLRPRVVVGTAFADGLSDTMLASALAHEAEHVRARDPLRYLTLELALAVNPFGRFLLAPHVGRWSAAREAHCDREAVIHGAAPLLLAEAIVRAARPFPRAAVALAGNDTRFLKFRIEMLFAFAERPPARCCQQGPSAFPMAFGLLLIALYLPHQTGTAALDLLHTGAEQALALLLR